MPDVPGGVTLRGPLNVFRYTRIMEDEISAQVPAMTQTNDTRNGEQNFREPVRRSAPVHPGEMLRQEFLLPLNLSANALALALRVPATRISEIVNERRGITADTAYRLSVYFGTTPDFWMHMQIHYELSVLQSTSSKQIRKEVRPRKND